MRLRSLSCPPSLRGTHAPPALPPQPRAPSTCSSSPSASTEAEESYDSGSASTDDDPTYADLISPDLHATVASVLERRFEQAMPLMSPSAGQLWFLI
ncbi:MAG TPA: hypothetical protein VLG41_20305 [Hydrogenophaga sp.]|uniref:hypothetical protein n=1 Tax=Hydrogenophaga sp. TaxID=1904254 RepID=UPI002BCE436B|nr:hypothetical protein [Hydrogenophaga sp.]HSX95279.1 hypothetical protein [Hydrogenophaga sp.]